MKARLCILAILAASALHADESPCAQILGTVHQTRSAWNPFDPENDLTPGPDGTFTREFDLTTTGGRNRDGIYSVRFVKDRELSGTCKRGAVAGKLVTGPDATRAGNIHFQVTKNGTHTFTFDPKNLTYSISPEAREIETISSLQINGFVHDRQGIMECHDGRRTRPAEIWDEWVPSHEFTRNADGSWSIDLPLSSTGGHEKNGVYQCLLSANNIGDWGYSAILGQPGKLAGGNGYDSRVGHARETAIVFRVSRDQTYRFTVWPEDFRFEISPPVEFFQLEEFDVSGNVVPEPWNPKNPEHSMKRGADGTWTKTLDLSTDGGWDGRGLYSMNFSIDGDWALDSVGMGGVWGRTWHSAPQESNIVFRVKSDGPHKVTFDPDNGTFEISPDVEPVTKIETLQLCGDFEVFAADGSGGWNALDPSHDMRAESSGVFAKDVRLTGGRAYSYKYSANRSAWAMPLVDYPYDGYARLASHGNPPPMRFDCPRDGIYRFRADTVTGRYSVELVKHL